MERIDKGIKKRLIFIVIPLMMLGSIISYCYGEDEGNKIKWGFSFSGGLDQKSKHDLTQWAFLPRLDLPLHRKWDFEIEGNFSYYGISDSKNLYLLGLNTNIIFKPIQWNKGSLFIIGGIGGAYNNNRGEIKDIGDSKVAGILQIGSGINYQIGKRWWLRGEYRFHHISDPFNQDSGMNTHNLILGLSF